MKAEVEGSKDAAAEGTPTNDWANDGKAAAANDGWGVPAETTGDAAPQDAAPTEGRRPREEEEDNTLTLDQYLAQQKEKELAAVPKLEIRKANEGADDSIWKDAVPLSKNNEEEYFTGKVRIHSFCPPIETPAHVYLISHRPSPLPSSAQREARRSTSRSMLALIALSAAVADVARDAVALAVQVVVVVVVAVPLPLVQLTS